MISIPEPCSEDFSKMTPTERGAFCSKCEIDTFDFRELSNHEINKVILKNKGQHLCGQFSNRQLDALNQGFINWKNQKTQTFRSKFVLALVMVFGLALFSCNGEEKQTISEIQTLQTVYLADPSMDKLAYINEAQTLEDVNLADYLIQDEEPLGCEYPVPGMVAFEEVVELVEQNPENYETAGIPTYTLGGGMSSVQYYEYLEDTIVPDTDESTLPEVVELDPDFFEANAYPNPTTSDATLALDIHEAGQFEIGLYDMSGRLVQLIYNGRLTTGRQNFKIELNAQNSGMYLVKVVSNGQNETVKIQKMN